MSWGTCYAGSNNIHFDRPAMMSDGKNYTLYNPACDLNKKIQEKNSLKNSFEYRQFLITNGISIMNKNNKIVCEGNSECVTAPKTNISTNKYLFSKISDNSKPYGYENSDLKNLYLSRQELNSKYVAPIVTQADLFKLRSMNN